MEARHIVVVLGVLFLAGATVSETVFSEISENDGVVPQDAESRILNGHKASDGQFPYQVAILVNKVLVCGGTLINERDVITAASCVINPNKTPKPKNSFRIGVGENDLNKYNDTNTYSAANIWAHEKYDPNTLLSNIAVIRINGSFHFGTHVFPAQLATIVPPTGSCTASGWGVIWNSPLAPNMQQLYYGNLNFIACSKITPVPAGVFCASSNLADVCQADIGGPLTHSSKLVGVVSHSLCTLGNPAVYTSVPAYVEWIRTTVIGVTTSRSSSNPSAGIVTPLFAVSTLLWAVQRR